jgi:hypothetical protein
MATKAASGLLRPGRPTPKAASRLWAKEPAATPKLAAMPAERPWVAERGDHIGHVRAGRQVQRQGGGQEGQKVRKIRHLALIFGGLLDPQGSIC